MTNNERTRYTVDIHNATTRRASYRTVYATSAEAARDAAQAKLAEGMTIVAVWEHVREAGRTQLRRAL